MTIIEKMDALIEKLESGEMDALIEKLESGDETFIKSFEDDFEKFIKNKSERKADESEVRIN